MAKKLSSFRLLSCALAVLATVAFIIACGEGISDDINDILIKRPINEALASLTDDKDRLSSIVSKPSSPSVPSDDSSSSEGDDPGDGDSSNSGSAQSSSDGEPSSASSPSSSSSEEVAQSSSGESQYILTCEIGVNKIILPKLNAPNLTDSIRVHPIVKCKTKESGAEATLTGSSIKWIYNGSTFSWRTPEKIIYPDKSIQVEIKYDAEVCQGEKASCTGELEICYRDECRGDPPKPSSSSVYIPPTPSSSSSNPPAVSSSSSTGGGNDGCSLTGNATSISLKVGDGDDRDVKNLSTGVYSITYDDRGWNLGNDHKAALKCAADVGTKICDGTGEWKWLNSGWSLGVSTWTNDLLQPINQASSGNTETTITNKKPTKISITGKAIKCEFGWY